MRYLPLAAMLLVVSPMSAKLAARFGSKLVVATGLGTVAVGLMLMVRLEADSGYGAVADVDAGPGGRNGAHDGTGDRVDHGLAAARPGRSRFRRQRHDP